LASCVFPIPEAGGNRPVPTWSLKVKFMKTLIALAVLIAVPAFSQTAKPPVKKKAVAAVAKPAAPPTVKPLVIPADATPNPDGTYAWKDKAGKKWTFAKTPFGISRMEDVSASPAFANLSTPDQFVKAFEVGDKVKFERQSPFGTTKWEKSKADLNDDERRILAAQPAAQAAAQAAQAATAAKP
jgi:hypothetical protein